MTDVASVTIPAARELERRADALRGRLPGIPVDVEALAGLVGIVDITVADISGSALLVGGLAGTYAVVLNRLDAAVRQRFSLAHEIGHLVIAPDVAAHGYREPVAARRGRSPLERSCDFYAGCLLMPRDELNALAGAPLAVVARRFEVSPAAVATRLIQIGLHAAARV